MDIKLKNIKISLIVLFFTTLIICTFSSCKTTKVEPEKQEEQIFIKQVHPREYHFDLYDLGKNLTFKKDKKTGLLNCTVDFTKFVREELPMTGDKIIFYYKGYPTKDVKGEIVAELQMPITNIERPVARNIMEKHPFEGNFYFVLPSNAANVSLTLKCTQEQKFSNFAFKLEPTRKSTNIAEERKAEKNALKKNFNIVEKPAEIIDYYNLTSSKNNFYADARGQSKNATPSSENTQQPKVKTQEEIEAEKAEQERLALEERKKEELKEFQKQQQEMKEYQQKLEETIQTITNTNVTRYEKEYLDDYVLTEYPLEEETEESPKKDNFIIADPDNPDDFGRTMLMKAAQEGNDWQINALINANADVNLKDKDGWTALMYAVRYQENLDCVELIINAGADVKAYNNFGTSALVLAANYNNNPEILKKLLSYYSPTDKDVLKSFILVLTGNTATEYMQYIKVNLFLDLSVPLNSFYEGKTPIMYAAESGNSTKVIKLLLDNNSITSIRSTEGKTAFDYAKENPKLKHDNIYWSLNNK